MPEKGAPTTTITTMTVDPETVRKLYAQRNERPRTDDSGKGMLEQILKLKGEGTSSRQRSARDQQRLYNITAAARVFSGSRFVQKDIDAYYGYSSEASLDIGFEIAQTGLFDNK